MSFIHAEFPLHLSKFRYVIKYFFIVSSYKG